MKINAKQNETLKDYAALESQISELEAKRDSLKDKVLKVLEAAGIDTLKDTFGTFSRVFRKKWEYSPALVQKEKEYNMVIKDKKVEENACFDRMYKI